MRAKDQVYQRLATVKALAARARVEFPQWSALQTAIDDKMEELDSTVKLRESGKTDAALTEVQTDRGRQEMAQIRELTGQLRTEEVAVYQKRYQAQLLDEKRLRIVLTVGVVLALALLGAAYHLGVLYLRQRDQAEAEILSLYEKLELRVVERTAELEARTRYSEEQARDLERSNADLAQFAQSFFLRSRLVMGR